MAIKAESALFVIKAPLLELASIRLCAHRHLTCELTMSRYSQSVECGTLRFSTVCPPYVGSLSRCKYRSAVFSVNPVQHRMPCSVIQCPSCMSVSTFWIPACTACGAVQDSRRTLRFGICSDSKIQNTVGTRSRNAGSPTRHCGSIAYFSTPR